MTKQEHKKVMDALTKILGAMEPLQREQQLRALGATAILFGLYPTARAYLDAAESAGAYSGFHANPERQ